MAKNEVEKKPYLVFANCIHEWACVMQCGGNPMAQDNATRCACYEDMKGSTTYFIGLMDGREEAKKNG